LDEKLAGLKKEIYIKHQELFKAVDEQKEWLKEFDKDPDYLEKVSQAFEGGVDTD
jgi:hypothetical protein